MALGLRAARRPLLARRRHAARRPGRRRPDRLAGGGAVGRRARARLAALRPRLPRADRGPARRGRRRSPRRRLRVRRRRALRGAGVVPPGRRDARDDHGRERLLRDHPGALGARPREAGGPRAEPAARPAREAALRAQQLPDAAGRLHDARRALSARVRERPRLARPARDLRARRGDPALLQPLAHGARRPGGSSRQRASVRSRSPSCSRRRTPSRCRRRRTTPPWTSSSDRCQTCHSGADRAARDPARDRRAAGAARGRDRGSGLGRARCRPGTRRG